MSTPIRLLLIEDSEDDAFLLIREIRRGGYDPIVTRVDNASSMREALLGGLWDLVIADYTMPEFNGLDALLVLKETVPDTPFILVSGATTEEIGASVMDTGAHDFITKNNLTRLLPAIRRELHEAAIRRESLRERDSLESRVAYLSRVQEHTINVLAAAAEQRDPFMVGHQRRVQNLACAIAREMKLSLECIEGIRIAAIIHDIGIIGIPTEILIKPGRLTELEMKFINTHPHAGYSMLRTIPFERPVARIILQHHERIDGSGYPEGIVGDEIMLEARIIAVAEVIEAMCSPRPYRQNYHIDVALDEISKHRGQLYDSDVVDACLQLFRVRNFALS